MSHLRNMRIMDGTSTDLAQVSSTGDVHIVLRNLGSSVSSFNGTQLNITNFNSTGGEIFNSSTNSGFVQITDGSGNVIGSLNNALNIHNADVHTIIVNRHFLDFDAATENPSVAISAGDITVLVVATAGFVVGGHIVIKDAGGDVREHHFDITAVVANTSITVDRPIGNDYTTSATLEVVVLDMNVAGSLAVPLIYSVKPPSDETWHISRVLISMTDQTVMDDAKFGGTSDLTNGVVLRELEAGTDIRTITNWKTNYNMKEDMYDIDYSSKAPAGFYGLAGRFTFERIGAIIKLDGSAGDELQILIQDNLTDLVTFRIKAQGHIEGA